MAQALTVLDRVVVRPRWRAGMHLLAARGCAAAFGWARTAEAWDRRYPQPTSPSPPPAGLDFPVMLRALRSRVRRSVLRPECKELSLACMAVARSCGIPADLVIGLRSVPLRGHVWVESEGEPLTDDGGSLTEFRPVARYRGFGLEPV